MDEAQSFFRDAALVTITVRLPSRRVSYRKDGRNELTLRHAIDQLQLADLFQRPKNPPPLPSTDPGGYHDWERRMRRYNDAVRHLGETLARSLVDGFEQNAC